MKKITIFTPTFNRAYCLGQCYDSLLRQTNKDFTWLIIDDGSSDGTNKLVSDWITENKLDIQYHYQENQGMHGAHNAAYRLITTELNVCVDSDDFMPDDAIDKILKLWEEYGDEKYAGILGLDIDRKGNIIGTAFPDGLKECKYYQLKSKYNVVGDKKFVYRTDIIKKYPEYPIFKEERFVPLGYKYMLIDQDYWLLCFNEVFCNVEYMEDGSSLNIFNQYKKHPRGFAHERKERMKYSYTFKERFKNAIHYVSSSIMIKNWKFLFESPKKILTFFAIPFGIILYIYIMNTTKKGVLKK
ncbi:glycosyltransferase family 2 protein [Flaviramulus sp. BrNp1-15]|uniref:glycosyltransferase family 2 protein n=1 Tax=Flaviramulus sp. BrNp1-15 TaxID=2916754 RepID=UPI001EE9A683|nr:glycosyltransferase family 2 protein [Flaviramulus sp. BrNp1-15]ULC58277.1 glycosyltransferase family 2 protein [Flaviramulus sp. BrNp1-15]